VITSLLQTLIDAASLGSLYALVALGLGLLFGILRLINFAHGDFITIGAYALIVPSSEATAIMFFGRWDWYAMVPIICAVVVAAALLADALVFRHLRRGSAPTLMIASFGVSYFIQNVILMIYGARPKQIDLWPWLSTELTIGALRVPLLQPVTIATTAILLIVLSIFLNRTSYGLQMRAASSDFLMARYLGVRGNFVIGLAFAISAILAGIVSLLFVTQTGSLSYGMGVPLVLFAFIATVVGGMGSLIGAVIGGFSIGVAMMLLQTFLPPELRSFREAFTFALVILTVSLRPQGLVPSKSLMDRV
jgi:branched-chain amino acid transport system permease protein